MSNTNEYAGLVAAIEGFAHGDMGAMTPPALTRADLDAFLLQSAIEGYERQWWSVTMCCDATGLSRTDFLTEIQRRSVPLNLRDDPAAQAACVREAMASV